MSKITIFNLTMSNIFSFTIQSRGIPEHIFDYLKTKDYNNECLEVVDTKDKYFVCYVA